MTRACVVILSILLLTTIAYPQTIKTVAGGGPNNLPSAAANLKSPAAVALDGAGNLFIASEDQNRVFKVDAQGQLTVFAGNGAAGFSGDNGPAIFAQLYFPTGLAVDSSGNVYIADNKNYRIRKVDTNGVITTVAGNGIFMPGGDNVSATSTGMEDPNGLAVDGVGNLYFAESADNRVRKVDVNGIVSTVAGKANVASYGGDNGPAINALLSYPQGLALDASGNLYIADKNNHRIRKVDINGIITTVAGNGTAGLAGNNGLAVNAQLNYPLSVALDVNGNLFIGDGANLRIRRVVKNTGIITTVAGNGIYVYTGDGVLATAAGLGSPNGLALDANGNIYIATPDHRRLRKVDANCIISTLAGNGTDGFSGENVPATNASLYYPGGAFVDAGGNIYIADTFNNIIRRVDAQGNIQTVAGNGDYTGLPSNGDGRLATAANLNQPNDVAEDAQGNLYIADTNHQQIRKVDTNGVITTVAGTGSPGYNGDNILAKTANLYYPEGVAVDANGNLFIADTFNYRIRKVDTNGIITTVAGIGTLGFTGDNNPATLATLDQPSRVVVDGAGDLFIADTMNDVIRKVDTNGIITTVAGKGPYGYGGDGGAATQAILARPTGVAVDASGNIFIADTDNLRVRRVGLNGKINTVVGNGTKGFSLDGVVPTSASLDKPSAVAVDAAGNIFFVETNNHRVRKALTDTTPPVITPTINGALGNEGWYTSDVTVSWTVSDPESTVSSAQGCGDVTINNDTAGVSYTCTATSAGGTSSQTVNIKRDATAPTLVLPNNITAELSGPDGTLVKYVAGAADNMDANPTFNCAPASGSKFQFGATTVTCTATDRAGNTVTGSFNVQVVDTTQPVVTAPALTSAPSDINCQAAVPNLLPQVVASDNSGVFTLKQNPAAGTLVGTGAHTINITATDGSNNSRTVTTTFTVIAGQTFAVSVNPDTVKRGGQTTLKIAFSNCAANAQALTLKVSLKTPNNNSLMTTWPVTLQAGQKGSLSFPLTIPKSTAPGLYTLTLDVYAGGVITSTSTAQLTITP